MRSFVRTLPAEALLPGSLPGRLLRVFLAVLLAASAVHLTG